MKLLCSLCCPMTFLCIFAATLLERGRHAAYFLLTGPATEGVQGTVILRKRKLKQDVPQSKVLSVGGVRPSEEDEDIKEAFNRLRFSDNWNKPLSHALWLMTVQWPNTSYDFSMLATKKIQAWMDAMQIQGNTFFHNRQSLITNANLLRKFKRRLPYGKDASSCLHRALLLCHGCCRICTIISLLGLCTYHHRC